MDLFQYGHQNLNVMLQCHKYLKTPSTRVIIDCTELFCQRPSSLTIQSSLFSHYKYHVTYKGLVGIAPSGGIIFVSELYDGSISDVEIVKRCGILQKELWRDSDSLMADRGFTIQNLLKPLGVSLNIPAFLQGREQLTMEEVTESQTIAAVRIHVERAIQRVKNSGKFETKYHWFYMVLLMKYGLSVAYFVIVCPL